MGQNTTYLTPALKAGNSGNPIDFFYFLFYVLCIFGTFIMSMCYLYNQEEKEEKILLEN